MGLGLRSDRTYLRFSAGNDPISWLIQGKTACIWSHVDFLIPETGRLLGALPGSGVQLRDRIRGETRFAIYEVPITEGFQWALDQVGKRYDWGAVVGLGCPFPVKRNWADAEYFFCSELVFISITNAGLDLLHPESWGITPRDLLLSPFLKKIIP